MISWNNLSPDEVTQNGWRDFEKSYKVLICVISPHKLSIFAKCVCICKSTGKKFPSDTELWIVVVCAWHHDYYRISLLRTWFALLLSRLCDIQYWRQNSYSTPSMVGFGMINCSTAIIYGTLTSLKLIRSALYHALTAQSWQWHVNREYWKGN